MSGFTNIIKSWLYSCAPRSVTSYTTAATSGTFQQTDAALLGKLHCLTSPTALKLLEGTGASVTATSGGYWPADMPYMFVPQSGTESVGFAAADGSATFSATNPVSVFVIERPR